MKEINPIRFKKVLLSELKAAPYNPRKKLKPEDPEFERIARSIEEFGYVDPIIINSDNTVIGGHQRVAVLKHKGYAACDAVVVDLDKTREKALNVALNKISGEWDFTLLKEVLDSLKDEDFDISLTGFDDEELMALGPKKEATEDDYEPPAEIETDIKRGDIIHLGRHRLMCGDSTCREDIERLVGGGY